jgi:hypothetical protein
MMADRGAYGSTGDRVTAADFVTRKGTHRSAFGCAGWLLAGIVRRLGRHGKAKKHGGQYDTSHFCPPIREVKREPVERFPYQAITG